MKFIILIALLSQACVIEQIFDVDQPTNKEMQQKPVGQDAAVNLIHKHYEWMLYDQWCCTANIRWFEGKCLNYDWTVEGQCITGTTQQRPNDTEIQMIFHEDISDTVIAHEMLHDSLLRVRNDLDARHTDPLWSTVDYTTQMLKDSGL